MAEPEPARRTREYRTLWILLVGDSGVGKTSFLNATKGGVIRDSPWSDMYNIRGYSVSRGEVNTYVQISSIGPGLMELSYSTMSRGKVGTFTTVSSWLNRCKMRHVAERVLVGNKSDKLESSGTAPNNSTETIVSNYLGTPSVKTSATTGKNVEEAIRVLITKIMDRTWPWTISAGLPIITSLAERSLQVFTLSLPLPVPNVAGGIDPAKSPSFTKPKEAEPASSSNNATEVNLPYEHAPKVPTEGNYPPSTIISSTPKPEEILETIRTTMGSSYTRKVLVASIKTRESAQAALNLLQKALYIEGIPSTLKHSIHAGINQISSKFDLSPEIPVLRNMILGCQTTGSTAPGTFGDTWKGLCRDQPLCLKVARVNQAESARRLIAECAKKVLALSQYQHPSILPFYGTFRLEGSPERIAIVTSWMPNSTINEYLGLNQETPRLPLIYDVLEGLNYLHVRQVVHGNLRPTNILITSAGSACIADFGLSSLKDVANKLQQDLQSQSDENPRWKAPELMNELANGSFPAPTQESDVYSVALVMYEILIGRPPFYDIKHDSSVVARVSRGVRPTKPFPRELLDMELSEEVWNIMTRSWEGSPSQRPTMHGVLESIRQINPIELTMTRMWKSMQKPRISHKTPLTLQSFRASYLEETLRISEADLNEVFGKYTK
ncbi:hypothetical protein NP233_g238 [Leucocoprinus birnbaumii]|uniref:Protein kinase domain-containing protein n=1 Tax=Leucocoprinus birnbaumii TaxID=56174 RepID=A0AAD5YWU9_9AGAR|nr:hypothetical protein NP233_g238 [Leucocoprinus birnbaumii]